MKMFIPREKDFEEFEIVEEGDSLKISDGKKLYHVDLKPLNGNLFSVLIDNQSFVIEALHDEKTVRVALNQHEYNIPVLNERAKTEAEITGASNQSAAKGEVRAPMPGQILKIEIEKGTPIQTGQPLIIMEAMKMENEIRSQVDGEIAEVLVKENQKVEKNDLLIRVK